MGNEGNRLILSDGTVLTGFSLNGTMLFFAQDVDTSIFEGRMKPVKVEADGQVLEYRNAQLITWADDPKAIAFTERDALEVLREEMESKLDYIAMMSDVDMEV